MSKSHLVLRLLRRILRLAPAAVLVVLGVPILSMAWIEGSKVLGLKPLPVPVVGTGSMYPSLYWSKNEGGPEDENNQVIEEYRRTPHLYNRFGGFAVFGRTYAKRRIGHGDIVAFQNDKTKAILEKEGKDPSAGYIKRVIGVPGDTLELRDGFVYRNNELLQEPYIAHPRSTYGGDSLPDCVKLTLAPNKYFVLGDNRKVSSDSRFELGVIDDSQIQFVLPYAEQSLYHRLYRDAGRDSELMGEPSLDSGEFLTLLNTKRQSLGIPKLAYRDSLVKSSTKRGEKLLQDSLTTYDMSQALRYAGYSNIVLGEFVSYGHFSAQELLENLLFNQNTAKQILNTEFDDLGLSAVNREVNGCPSQVIVGHLGGYLPANYSEDTLSGWRSLRDNLTEVIPSWEGAIGNARVNQAELQELLGILRRRLALAQQLVQTMEKREWLSEEQTKRIEADPQDAQTAETLAKKLNQE